MNLQAIAADAMRENGLEPEVNILTNTSALLEAVDLRALPWSSIDNRESRDLDQIEVAERTSNDAIIVRIAAIGRSRPRIHRFRARGRRAGGIGGQVSGSASVVINSNDA